MWIHLIYFRIPHNFRVNKFGAGSGGGDDTTSRDSDSLIQEYINMPPTEMYPHCWNHPKIRENWRTVLAAVLLLVIGIALVTMGIFAIANPASGSQGFVFLLAGRCSPLTLRTSVQFNSNSLNEFQSLIVFVFFSPLFEGFICFIPGAYHVVYIWLAAIGYRGYNFYHLPLFT